MAIQLIRLPRLAFTGRVLPEVAVTRQQATSARLLVFAPEPGLNNPVKLDLQQKQTLYHELSQFMRSGIPLPQAVEALAQDSGRGPLRRLLEHLTRLFLSGVSVPDAFAQLRPAVGSMELALVEAAHSSGKLEQAFVYLSNYFGSLATLRSGLIRKSLWPFIQLHLGIVILTGVDQFVRTSSFDPDSYLRDCGLAFGVLYASLIVLWLGGSLLLQAGRANTVVDRLLNLVPLVGRLRRNMALSRFCAAFVMQLQAAINVMDGLRVSADASQSARVRAAAEEMIPRARAGESLGPLFSKHDVFPRALQRAVRVGEETGTLDEDLYRWADYYHQAAVAALEAIGNWVPKICFLLIGGYLGYKIVTVYATMMHGMENILNSN